MSHCFLKSLELAPFQEVREVAIIGALAAGGGGVELIPMTSKSVISFASSTGIKPVTSILFPTYSTLKPFMSRRPILCTLQIAVNF